MFPKQLWVYVCVWYALLGPCKGSVTWKQPLCGGLCIVVQLLFDVLDKVVKHLHLLCESASVS